MIPMLPEIPQPASSEVKAGSVALNPAGQAQILRPGVLRPSLDVQENPLRFERLVDGFAQSPVSSNAATQDRVATGAMPSEAEPMAGEAPLVRVEHREASQADFAADPGALLPGDGKHVQALPARASDAKLTDEAGAAAIELTFAANPSAAEFTTQNPVSARPPLQAIDPTHEAPRDTLPSAPQGSVIAMASVLSSDPAREERGADARLAQIAHANMPAGEPDSQIAGSPVLVAEHAAIIGKSPQTQFAALPEHNTVSRAVGADHPADSDQLPELRPELRSNTSSQMGASKRSIENAPDFPIDRALRSDTDRAPRIDPNSAMRARIRSNIAAPLVDGGQIAASVAQPISAKAGLQSTRSAPAEIPANVPNAAPTEAPGTLASTQAKAIKQPGTLSENVPMPRLADAPLRGGATYLHADSIPQPRATQNLAADQSAASSVLAAAPVQAVGELEGDHLNTAASPVLAEAETGPKLRPAPQLAPDQLPISAALNAQLRPAPSRNGHTQMRAGPVSSTQQSAQTQIAPSNTANIEGPATKALTETPVSSGKIADPQPPSPVRAEAPRMAENEQLFQAAPHSSSSQFTAASSALAANAQPSTVQTAPAPAHAPSAVSDARGVDAIETTIDRLIETRETARAQRPELTVRHSEFGAVHVRLDAAGGDLRATLANRDPGFVPAVQAALADRAVAPASETAMTGQRSPDQQNGSNNGGQNPSQTGNPSNFGQHYGSSTGSEQGSSQPYSEQSSVEESDSAQSGLISEDQNPQNDQSAGGLFA